MEKIKNKIFINSDDDLLRKEFFPVHFHVHRLHKKTPCQILS